jgi:hypothetical protein
LGEIDFDNKVLPAIFLQNSKDYSKDYLSNQTVVKETKAIGTIRVYNKYSPPTPLTLIKGTHFLSSNGKSFHSLDVVRIPAAHYEGGELVPGYVDIQVEADEVGEEYNIPASTFSVPKLSGTPYYQTTWAESFDAMKGGEKKQVKVVSFDDIEKAKEDFLDTFKNKAKEDFKPDIPESFIYFEDSFSGEIEGLEVSAKEGDEKDSFTVKGRIITKVLVFRQEDLNNLAKYVLEENISSGLQVIEESLKIEIEGKEINLAQGEEKLNLLISAQTFLPVNNEEVINLIKGQEINNAISALTQSYPINEVKVITPIFWQKSIPEDTSKIKLKLNLTLDKV